MVTLEDARRVIAAAENKAKQIGQPRPLTRNREDSSLESMPRITERS